MYRIPESYSALNSLKFVGFFFCINTNLRVFVAVPRLTSNFVSFSQVVTLCALILDVIATMTLTSTFTIYDMLMKRSPCYFKRLVVYDFSLYLHPFLIIQKTCSASRMFSFINSLLVDIHLFKQTRLSKCLLITKSDSFTFFDISTE